MAFSAYLLIQRALMVSCIAVSVTACSSHRAQPTTAEETEIPLELHWVMNSAEYRAICMQVYSLAEERLEDWAEGREPGSWAISLDADETVLANSGYQEWLAATGEVYTSANWQTWVLLEVAEAVPGARAFLERIHELGGKIAIVTNRRMPICEATESNLRALDLPFDLLLCKQDDSSKESRWRSIREGRVTPGIGPLEILMWFGDNIHDFPAWSQSRRGDEEASFGEFGSRFFVLPNPLYGSWESNPR